MMFEEKTTQEALDFWGGTLADVKEEKMLIPPTTNVKLQVYETKVINQNQDGTDRNWKMLVVRFKIVDGVKVGSEVKYKNSIVQTETMCYFANLDCGRYDITKPFFFEGKYLFALKQLCLAIGLTPDSFSFIKGGLSEGSILELTEALKGRMVLGNIVQKPTTELNSATGTYEKTETMENVVRGIKALPDNMLV